MATEDLEIAKPLQEGQNYAGSEDLADGRYRRLDHGRELHALKGLWRTRGPWRTFDFNGTPASADSAQVPMERIAVPAKTSRQPRDVPAALLQLPQQPPVDIAEPVSY